MMDFHCFNNKNTNTVGSWNKFCLDCGFIVPDSVKVCYEIVTKVSRAVGQDQDQVDIKYCTISELLNDTKQNPSFGSLHV